MFAVIQFAFLSTTKTITKIKKKNLMNQLCICLVNGKTEKFTSVIRTVFQFLENKMVKSMEKKVHM